MVNQFLINVIIAFVWTFLQPHPTWRSFLMGYAAGLLVLYLYFLAAEQRSPFYLRVVWAAAVLLGAYFYEVGRSALRVSYLILHPRLPVSPGIVRVPLDVQSPGAVATLAGMITMAPGTFTIDLSEDGRYLYVHALEAEDPDEVTAEIKERLERRILRVWR